MGRGEPVNVEFVSANPTGPMHVGHGRGAVVGDALAGLLAKAGFEPQREYYVNDAGAQVDTLARSAHLRYREALGEPVGAIPDGLYPGEYLIETGRALAQRDGGKWLGRPEAEWLAPVREFAVAQMMALIRADLAALGVAHDLFVSERELVEGGAIDECLGCVGGKRAGLYRGIGAPEGQGCRMIGSRASRPCSARPALATMSIARSGNRTAPGLISPPTSPIIATSSAAVSAI